MRNISLMLFILCFTGNAMASTESTSQNDLQNTYQKKWQFRIGASAIDYQLNMPTFNGTHHSVEKKDTYPLIGAEVEIDRHVELGESSSLRLAFGTHFFQSTDLQKGKGAEDIDVVLSETKDQHTLYLASLGLGLNYNFEMLSLLVSPSFELGVSIGQGQLHRSYQFQGIAQGSNDSYDAKIKEQLLSTSFGVGLSFQSSKGIQTYLKAMNHNLQVSSRELTGSSKAAYQELVSVDDNSLDDISYRQWVYTLGVGFSL